jgi:lipopolysaccharide transport system permease protein
VHPRLLLAPVAVLISLAFAVSIGFWSSVLQAQHRDIRFGLQYSLTFFIFATTVLYPLSQIKHPLLRWMVYLNPMESAIELFRFATLGMPLELNRVTFAGQLIAILMVGLTGVWFFNREEAASVDKL